MWYNLDVVKTKILFLIKFRFYSYPILLAEAIRFLIMISALSCVRIKIIQIDIDFVLPFPVHFNSLHIRSKWSKYKNIWKIHLFQNRRRKRQILVHFIVWWSDLAFVYDEGKGERDLKDSRNDPNIRIVERFTCFKIVEGSDKSSCILSSDDLIWRSCMTRGKEKGTWKIREMIQI